VQQGNQRQHFQQRSPYQQPGGQQTPRSGNPNATPIKNSAPNTPTRCFRCGKERHMSFNCPEKQNQYQSYSSNQKPTQYGKVNHVSSDTAQKAPKVMLGTFNINSIPATVLFDFGASHSFISQVFIREHSIPLVAMKDPMIVNSTEGTMPASYCCPLVSLSLRGVDFPVSLVVLKTSGIDVILGMDWMKQHLAMIQCKEKVVTLTTPKGDKISVEVAVQAPPIATVNQLDDEANN
jgi:hypothetical protein